MVIKKTQNKQESVTNLSSNGGLGLPNFRIYHMACSLVWIKDWILLRDQRTLSLEGHDLLEGWHRYIWYNITKKNSLFKKHYIRQSLLRIWSYVKEKICVKTPRWVTPIDASRYQNLINWKQILTYKDVLNSDGLVGKSTIGIPIQ